MRLSQPKSAGAAEFAATAVSTELKSEACDHESTHRLSGAMQQCMAAFGHPAWPTSVAYASPRLHSLARLAALRRQQMMRLRRQGLTPMLNDEEGTIAEEHEFSVSLRIRGPGGNAGGGGDGRQENQSGHHDRANQHERSGRGNAAGSRTRAAGMADVPELSDSFKKVASDLAATDNPVSRATRLRDAWHADALDLQRSVGTGTAPAVVSRALKLARDWQLLQLRCGPLPPPQMDVLRRHSSIQGPPDERGQQFNLLFGLIWLNASAPLTPAQRRHGIARLDAFRSANITALANVEP